ncbi:MAG: response regulator transcription factor [Coriobacteriia bacterium]
MVLACQRIGNALGELAATGINATWSLTATSYAVIGLLIAYTLAAAFVVPLIRPRRATAEDSASEGEPEHAATARLREEFGLSPREIEVLELLVENRSMGEIERSLHVSTNTVKTHTQRIYQKLGVHSKAELIELLADEE